MTQPPIITDPGTESVWDYPRPPRLEGWAAHFRVTFADVEVANANFAYRVLETSHPPTIYLPPHTVRRELLRPTSRRSICEWKGQARFLDLVVGDQVVAAAAWSYPNPVPAFDALCDHVAFYPSRVTACHVDGERVLAQPGDFYGGWITSNLRGPFKGGAGTVGW